MNRSTAAIGIGVLLIAVIVGVTLFLQLPSPHTLPEQAREQSVQPQSTPPSVGQAAGTSVVRPATPAPETAPMPAGPAAPKFDVVRVDKKGNVVIAGKADPDCAITVRDGETVVGAAVSDRRGDWVIVPGEPLKAGESQISLSSQCGDAAPMLADRVVVLIVPERAPVSTDVAQGGGKTVRAPAETSATEQASVGAVPDGAKRAGQAPDIRAAAETASAVPSGATPLRSKSSGAAPVSARPAAPASKVRMAGDTAIVVAIPRDASRPGVVLQSPAPEGVSVSSVDYNDAGQVVISGSAEPGSTVQVYLDNRIVGRAASGTDGAWRLLPDVAVEAGKYALRADQVTVEGKVIARAEIPFVRGEPLTNLSDDRIVVIQPGDHLWKIARASYGEGTRYTLIYDANRGQISNPDLIYPGQIFTLPRVN